MSESQLAEALGVADAQLADWETGEERISAKRLIQIATALQCEISYFFEGLPGVPRTTLRRYFRVVGGTDPAGSPDDGAG